MKSFLRRPFLLLAMFLPSVSFAEPVRASLLALQGEVKVNGAPASQVLPSALPSKATVVTGTKSAAMIAPVPGQFLFVGADTEVKSRGSDVVGEGKGGQERRSSFQLVKGHVHSTIRHSAHGVSAHSIVTSAGTLSARGTSWATWADAKGVHFAVYSGVVFFTFGGAVIEVQPGQVGFVSGEGDAAELVIVDLKTGQLMRYGKGGSGAVVRDGKDPVAIFPPSASRAAGGTVELASTAILLEARDAFEAGMGAFIGTASTEERLALSLLMDQINRVLVQNHLAPIVPPLQFQLFPNWFNDQRGVPQNTASPDQPVN